MDRVQRMVENQKKREEAMKVKDAQAKAEVEAAKPKPAPAPAKPSAAAGQSDKPMENKYSQKRAMYAPLPQTERGKPVLLGGDPQGENILYINGQNVVVRSLKNPLIASMYSEHAYAPTVARYSPCGRYIASGDSAGNIRVWNTEVVQNTVFKTTFERKMLGAGIQEIVWDPESKRMVAVGTGRETFGVGFFTDSGASLGGGITGHSKTITCCDWRPVKPYRLVTGSEDTTVCWFDCPPIKWKKANKGHQRFVNSVKFNPSGSLVLSVGQDKKGFFYDGDSGDQVDEMANSHSGGIYACSWSADGSRVLTASGDRTCQIYDVSAKKTVVTFNMGDDVDDQQVGCLWQGDFLISLSLNGVLNYLDPNSGKVVKQIRGHAKSITSLAYNNATHSFYSGSYDAVINRWNEESGDAQVISGKGGHTNAVKGMAIQPSTSTLVTVGLDDAVRFTPLDAKDYTQTKSAALDSNATGVALSHKGDYSIATSLQSVSVFKGTQKASSVPAPWKPQSVAFSVDDSEVAVGGEDNKVHLFSFSGGQLSEKSVLEGHRGPVTTAAYSPDGKYLATADKNREIVIWDNSSKQPAIKEWVYHTARVNAVAWSPDSAHLASVSLDQNLIIWTAAEPSMRINIKGAHQGSIDNVLWLDNSTVATSGQDATIRTWNINFSKPN